MSRHIRAFHVSPRRFSALLLLAFALLLINYLVASNVDPRGMARAVDNLSLIRVNHGPLRRLLEFISPVVRQPTDALLTHFAGRLTRAQRDQLAIAIAYSNINLLYLGIAAANTEVWLLVLLFLRIRLRVFQRGGSPDP